MEKEIKYEVCDFRYDEGLRSRVKKDIVPTIPAHIGHGKSEMGDLNCMVKEVPTLVGGVGNMTSNNNTQYYQQNRIYDSNAVALCQSGHKEFNPWYTEGGDENQHIRIRKLTPRECWRSSHGFR